MKIIALIGKDHCGKTTTLNIVHDLMLENGKSTCKITIGNPIYKDFSDIIEQNPDFIAFEFEGEGRIPYLETTNGNRVNHPSKYYKYTDLVKFNNLASIMNEYSSENIEENSGVTISIYSWNNIKFHSWIEN